MTLIDIIVLAIICLFGLAGAKRGSVWEIFTIVGSVAGLLIPYVFNRQIGDSIAEYMSPGLLRIIATFFVFLFIFAMSYSLCSYIGYSLRKVYEKTFLKWVDRILGAFVGFVKGGLLVALVLVALSFSPWQDQGESFVRKSKVLTWGKKQVEKIIHREPAEFRKRV
jgi:membrane protein required for colicin V production